MKEKTASFETDLKKKKKKKERKRYKDELNLAPDSTHGLSGWANESFGPTQFGRPNRKRDLSKMFGVDVIIQIRLAKSFAIANWDRGRWGGLGCLLNARTGLGCCNV